MGFGGERKAFCSPFPRPIQQWAGVAPIRRRITQELGRVLLGGLDARVAHRKFHRRDVPIKMEFVGSLKNEQIRALIGMEMARIAVGIDKLSAIEVPRPDM